MTFTRSIATPEDIPGIVDCDLLAFDSPQHQAIMPSTEPVRKWMEESFLVGMHDKDQNATLVIITEDTGKVVAFARYLRILGGPLKHWKKRWTVELPEGMSEEKLGVGFLEPLDRQQLAVMGERPHICLEILATHPGYRKLGLASQLIQWGCDEADKEGLECFLNASKLGKPLYEKHGYAEQMHAKDPVVPSAAMLRSARKVDVNK